MPVPSKPSAQAAGAFIQAHPTATLALFGETEISDHRIFDPTPGPVGVDARYAAIGEQFDHLPVYRGNQHVGGPERFRAPWALSNACRPGYCSGGVLSAFL
jgi:hypothetical protein